MPKMRQIGIVELLLSGLFFGFMGYWGKLAFAKGVAPFELLALRFTIAACVLGLFLILGSAIKGTNGLRALYLGRTKILLCLSLGIFGYAIFSSFFFLSLERVSASLTVILLYLYPIIVAIGGSVFLGERIPRVKIPVIPLAFLGLIFLVWRDVTAGSALGVIFGALGAVFYSVYILISAKWLKDVNPFVSTFWIQLGAGVTLLFIGYHEVGRVVSVLVSAWQEVILVAVVCSVLAMSLFLSGLSKVKSWEASMLSMAEPITGVGVGIILLGESLDRLQLAGAAMVLFSLIVVSLPTRRSRSRLTG